MRILRAGLFTVAMIGLVHSAQAGVELVVNGGFTQTSLTTSNSKMTTTNVTGWSTTGYNFVFFSASAATSPVGTLSLWGGNGFIDSPDGGNFIGADGAYQVGAITQTINGLTVGQSYALSFDWGGAQQNGFTGVTTEQWAVSLGGQTDYTPVLTDPSHGFTGWTTTTFDFVATNASEVLSFLAIGTPDGEPPFSLLDGVSLQAVPEPSSWIFLVGVALLATIGFGRRGGLRLRSAVASGSESIV
jgi:hypothetical protein